MPSSLKRKRVRETQQFQRVQQRIEFSGPLPPPAFIEKYDNIIPNGAERILALVEKQQSHRHELEKKVIYSDVLNSRLGIFFAFLISITGISAGTWLGANGYELAGGFIGIGGVGSIVATFIYGTKVRQSGQENNKRVKTRK